MFYLYLKTHNITGKKYLGQTTKDPFKYKGSGTYWIRHISVHGNDVKTVILKICRDKNELKKWGLYYSKLWSVSENPDFANLMEENGDGSGNLSKESRDKISRKAKGRRHTEETKRKLRESLLGHKVSEETKQKLKVRERTDCEKNNMRKARLGKKHDTNTKQKISKSLKGREFSEETKLKMRNSKIGRTFSEESRKKMSNSQKNKIVSEETKLKMRKAHLNNPIIECPHCGKNGKGNSMKRWHFENCKSIVDK